MAKTHRLILRSATGDISFDVEPDYFPKWVPVYKEGSNPLQITEMRLSWTLRHCRFVGVDAGQGVMAGLWTTIRTLYTTVRARPPSSSGHPTRADLVNVATGNIEFTVGPGNAAFPDQEQFRIDSIDGEPNPELPLKSWSETADHEIVVSAVVKTLDANNLAAFDQKVSQSFPGGLQVLQWNTRMSVKENADARTFVAQFAAIPAAGLGGRFAYETNGPLGADYVTIDADEPNARKPTVIECVSRVRQYGIALGVTAPGGSPSEFQFNITTKTVAGRTTVTTFASAKGPNAKAFVLSKTPPAGSFNSEEIIDDPAILQYSTTWTQELTGAGAANGAPFAGVVSYTKVTLSGGHRETDFDPAAGSSAAVQFDGGFLPWKAVVDVKLDAFGLDLGRSDMPLPARLPAPWKLVFNDGEFDEGEPHRVEVGVNGAPDRWNREALYTYYATEQPPLENLRRQLEAGAQIEGNIDQGAGP